jgi:outer membrane protein OmpA-like peptidoglycan-associated protein
MESRPTLNELLAAMKDFPNLVIRVEGHICCQPGNVDGYDFDTRQYNLSAERAKAVMDFLIDNGISSERVSYVGLGHSNPIHPYPEETEEQKTMNRRVEIKIIKK